MRLEPTWAPVESDYHDGGETAVTSSDEGRRLSDLTANQLRAERDSPDTTDARRALVYREISRRLVAQLRG